MMSLTKQQSRALDIIRTANSHGTAPSYEELCKDLGIASKNGVYRLVRALEERGAIRRLPGRARALEAIEPDDPLSWKSRAELVAMRDRIDLMFAKRAS